MKKILISGAGVAGLTLAYWLKRYGFSPTIVEKSPSLRTGGYKIDIRGAALEVVKRMGIHSAILEAKTDIQGATHVDSSGKELTTMSGDLFGYRTGSDLEIVRGDLCHILFDQVHDVECLFGDSIISCSDSSNTSEGVYVEFKKNQPRHFDLVVGADGLHSTVRNLIFGEESKWIRELGIYISVFTVPNFLKLDRFEIEYTEPSKFVNLYSTRGSVDAKACLIFFDSSSIRTSNRDEQQKILEEKFSESKWEIPRLLQAMKDSPDFYFDSVAQIEMPSWSKGRIVLLGDAGYSASPMSGQGTSVALVAAYVLAGELLIAKGDFPSAFLNYERALRSFVTKNQKLAIQGEAATKNSDETWFSRLIFHITRLLPESAIQFLARHRLNQIAKAANAISLKDYTS